jgi:hypothetical protein
MQDKNKREIAHELKKLFNAVSPFMEKHTALICPLCEKVCCINKHGRHTKEDIYFFAALGMKAPSNDRGRKDTDPCGFLAADGCSLERWERPFRCTWFFCDPLLESMKDNGKAFREFVNSLNMLILIRQKLIEK